MKFGVRTTAAVTVTLLLALIAGAAAARDLVRTPSEYLGRMDRDRDGRVALLEYQDYLSTGFHRMDRDGNGQLSATELPPGARARRGLPTIESHRRALAATFDRQDADNNGYLDARELAAPPR